MPVELTRNGAAAVITLNRPEALNALSFEVIGDIGEKKPPWYTDVSPTGQTPSAVGAGEIVWESSDIMLAIETTKTVGQKLSWSIFLSLVLSET